jgi:FAD/FMN-containing dehydrogenase
VLLVELDGSERTVEAESAVIERLLRQHGARDVRSAAAAAERARLWQGRKKAFGALGRLAPDLVVQDAVVPRSALPDVLDSIAGIRDRLGIQISNVFHAGDGNLHPCISFDRRQPGLTAKVEEASREIMRVCLEAGGSITGEHGVGRTDGLHALGLQRRVARNDCGAPGLDPGPGPILARSSPCTPAGSGGRRGRM